MIKFNKPPVTGDEITYISDALNNKLSGDGKYTALCNSWLEDQLNTAKSLLTTSCTHALEMAAILCDIKEGDEVIMPSYTFTSTATSFALRGAKIVFVDIKPDTLNIDENLIENAITDKTKAICVVHYAGVACEMDKIMEIANKYNLFVVEDAAQAIFSTYKGKPLGTIGDFGTLSFHETKNLTMGEGGSLLIRDSKNIERAEIIREKGTNRKKFFRGEIDKYSWVDIGSSFLPSELNASYLYAQLLNSDKIQASRMNIWNKYYELLKPLIEKGIKLPHIPENCQHNAHMFYLILRDSKERDSLMNYLKSEGIYAIFHYVPLHESLAGKKLGRFNAEDVYTSNLSSRLLRLPLYYGLSNDETEFIADKILNYIKRKD